MATAGWIYLWRMILSRINCTAIITMEPLPTWLSLPASLMGNREQHAQAWAQMRVTMITREPRELLWEILPMRAWLFIITINRVFFAMIHSLLALAQSHLGRLLLEPSFSTTTS